MRFLSVVAAIFLVGLVSACGPTYQTVHDFTAPATAEGKLCASQCQTIQNHCRATCSAQTSACESKMKLDAMQEFERYAQQQRAAGKAVERTASWYEHPFACSSSACANSCGDDFRVCYANCGGKVTSKTICTSGCDR